ncbi:ATP-binding cassette domain-containing protein [Streptomyces sp. NPDC028635]|uniref:ATP-binding cassette domain-containing protein n=1 Tax=Streptomyces sp. NPDC028635 TaxID=3154800 RepID=UPI0033F9EA31
MDDDSPGLAVAARGLGLKGPRGWAFRGVDIETEPGSLIAVTGPSGSGRTCLLLALTGRMRPTEGSVTVGGHRLPRQMAALRRVAALAHVPGVTDLDPALTVGEHLRERALLQRRFGDGLRSLLRPRAERAATASRRVEEALTSAGLDLDALPKGPRTAVRDLERLEALRLSIALALIGRPGLLGVDDADLKLADAERAEMWALLRSLTEAGITVAAVCSEAPDGAVTVSTGGDQKTGADATATGNDEKGRAGEATAEDGGNTGATDETAEDTDKTRAGDATVKDDEKEAAADALAETGRS